MHPCSFINGGTTNFILTLTLTMKFMNVAGKERIIIFGLGVCFVFVSVPASINKQVRVLAVNYHNWVSTMLTQVHARQSNCFVWHVCQAICHHSVSRLQPSWPVCAAVCVWSGSTVLLTLLITCDWHLDVAHCHWHSLCGVPRQQSDDTGSRLAAGEST